MKKASVTLLASMIVSLFGNSSFADFYPTSGMSLRTNSKACLAKYKEAYELMGAYFNGMPALSTVKRIDVLTGGVAVNNATSDALTGKVKASLYPTVSTYASDPAGIVIGNQQLTDYYLSIKQGISSNLKFKGDKDLLVELSGLQHENCEISTLADRISLKVSKTLTQDGRKYYTQIHLFDNSYNKPCGDSTKKTIDLINVQKEMYLKYQEPSFPYLHETEPVTFESINSEQKIAILAQYLEDNIGVSYSPYSLSPIYSNLISAEPESYEIYEYAPQKQISEMTSDERKAHIRNDIRYFAREVGRYRAINSFLNDLTSTTLFKNTTLSTICSKVK